MYYHRYTPIFQDCIDRYHHRAEILAAVTKTLAQLADNPFRNPKLQTHRVLKAQPDTFTSYVTNQGHRLIWRRVERVIVLLLFGEHDAVYRRAEKLRLEIDDEQQLLRVMDEDPQSGESVPYQNRRRDEGVLFMAWNDRELTELGFGAQEIPVLRTLDTDQDLVSLDGTMRPEAWDRAMNLVMYGNPEGTEAPPFVEEEEEPPPEPADAALVDALADPEFSPEFIPVAADRLADVLQRPIEDWMVYLDPEQRGLVERNHNGPARIRGAAGTGKTVVALHRARRLAAGGKRVLFTTYVRNLPDVYAQVFGRWAPGECARVEFAGVHSWALRYLKRHGEPIHVDPDAAAQAWSAAVAAVAGAGSRLREAGLTPYFLQEEVDWVVRGRGLQTVEDYLGLERNGRGTPLGRELRQEVWRLSQAYEGELSARRVSDFTDVLLRAHEVAETEVPEYEAVIVDEAQDLTDVALRLLHSVVGNQPNGLLLVGDGQQSIYPGGFNLASAGVNVVGRSHVLTRNYRNTREILETAESVVRADVFDDGGPVPEPGRREVTVGRTGVPPRVVAASDDSDHDVALLDAVEDAATSVGVSAGDVAVLVPTNQMVKDVVHLLNRRGLNAQQLKDYDGRPNDRPKVGTYQRAKGLEFKHVFLPRLDQAGTQGVHRDPEARAEYQALVRRQLFVAMTRARDGLWLGWAGPPSDLIPKAVLDEARVA